MHDLVFVNSSEGKKIFENNKFNNKNNKFNNGDILKTTVINKNTNSIILETDDNIKFKTNISNININIGDIINFKVIKNKNNISLKFINKVDNLPSNINNKHLSNKDITSLFKQSSFIKKSTPINLLDNENIKKSISISKLKNKIKYVKNNLSLSVVNELLSNGVSFKNIDLDMLNCVLYEIKTTKFNISKKENKNISCENYIVDKLNVNKLPLTKENVEHINKSLKFFESAKNIDNYSISHILKDNKKIISLKDLYISKYSSNSSNNINKDIYNIENDPKLYLEITNFLSKENININEENINISKFLIENKIPVTKNNIYTTNFLQNIDKFLDYKQIIKSSIYNLKINKNPDDINIYNKEHNITLKEIEDNYKNILNNLQKISFKEIIFLDKNKLPVNLLNLQNCLNNNINDISKNNINNNTIKHKLYLSEIQLKLTSYASYKLINKNIKIDILPLKKVVEELRNLEKENYKNILEYKNIEPNKTNINKMYNTFYNISGFKNLHYNIYNKLFNNSFYPSINNINKAILSEKFIEEYSLFSTYPNKKYGDSLKNLNSQIETLLKNLNIEHDINNIKSAKILFKNNIDINYENITKINIITEKLNNIKEKFHPFIAANMIKDGINPLNIHIDEILDYIYKFNNKYDNNLNNKLYENILKLDKLDNISEKEKNSILAIYKMIHHIEKNDFAALGTNIISGHSITLGNLLDASKYYNKTKGKSTYKDIKIDTNFTNNKIISDKNIKKLLNETFLENSKKNYKEDKNYSNNLNNIVYNKFLISSLGEKLTYNTFKTLIKNNKDLFNKPISNILKELENNQLQNNIKENNIMSDINNILNQDIKVLYFMEKNNIPLTSYNIKIINNLKNNKNYLEDSLNYIFKKNNNKNYLNKLEKSNTWQTYLENISDDLENIIFNTNDPSIIDKIILLKNSIKIKSNIDKNKNNYSIPIKLKNKITSLNMFIKNNNLSAKNNIEIGIYINIPSICEIKSYIIKNNNDIYIKEDPSSNNILKNNKNYLEKLFESKGFNLKDITSYKYEDNNYSTENLNSYNIKQDIFNISSIIKEFLNNI